ncbi:hypothetical protein [Coleofasciculus sp.]|uniref:hypothetical protein n=1 Tax=Coleofasciculus sp. TaxID=3100458 RepID=UPI0039FA23BB
MWIPRSIGASENYIGGGIIRPSEKFLGNLAVFFGTSSSVWKGSDVFVRGVFFWDKALEASIYTPFVKISFNERVFIERNQFGKPPFQVEFLLNSNITNYSFSIWEERVSYRSYSNLIEVTSLPQVVLSENTNRESMLLINQGAQNIYFAFGEADFSLELEPGYSMSLEPGSFEVVRAKSSLPTNLKTIEVSFE